MFIKLKRKEPAISLLDNLSDELLVSQYLESGNKELIAVLFERYTHLVYGICLNYLQEPEQCKDAVMDIFESLFDKLAMHRVSNFRNWLYSVTRNHCLMSIRRSGSLHRVQNRLKTETEETDPDSAGEDEDFMLNQGVLVSAVEQLNHEQGTCIRLMYIDDMSYRDISAITGFTLNEVKSHIQNGKRNLKNYLLNQNGHTNKKRFV